MSSLRAFIPVISPALGLSPLAVYDRTRPLIRLGMLPTPQGRGRGSGAEATPETVAALIIAVLATPNLSDTDARVRKLADAPYVDEQRRKTCPITGERTFGAALTETLRANEIDDDLVVQVSRERIAAKITGRTVSYFGLLPQPASSVEVDASLPPAALHFIREQLAEYSMSEADRELAKAVAVTRAAIALWDKGSKPNETPITTEPRRTQEHERLNPRTVTRPLRHNPRTTRPRNRPTKT
jgi:hypothetical protein